MLEVLDHTSWEASLQKKVQTVNSINHRISCSRTSSLHMLPLCFQFFLFHAIDLHWFPLPLSSCPLLFPSSHMTILFVRQSRWPRVSLYANPRSRAMAERVQPRQLRMRSETRFPSTLSVAAVAEHPAHAAHLYFLLLNYQHSRLPKSNCSCHACTMTTRRKGQRTNQLRTHTHMCILQGCR